MNNCWCWPVSYRCRFWYDKGYHTCLHFAKSWYIDCNLCDMVRQRPFRIPQRSCPVWYKTFELASLHYQASYSPWVGSSCKVGGDLNNSIFGLQLDPNKRWSDHMTKFFSRFLTKSWPNWMDMGAKYGITEGYGMYSVFLSVLLMYYVAAAAFWMSVSHLSAPCMSMPAAVAGVWPPTPLCGLM